MNKWLCQGCERELKEGDQYCESCYSTTEEEFEELGLSDNSNG